MGTVHDLIEQQGKQAALLAGQAAKRLLERCRGVEGKAMRTVTLGVSSIEDTKRQMAAAFQGEQQGEFISFASIELLWKVLTAKRWEILGAMTGQGALSIREVARRVGRDVKAVHGDVRALINAGVLDREGDSVIFPYDAVHVDFTLSRAA
jgi:predicted transcriptional regulator